MRSARIGPYALLCGLLLVVGAGLSSGTAYAAEGGDPLEPANRKIFAFNDGVDRWLLRPVAQGYDRVTPDPVQRSIGNVFTNLGTPGVALNQLLQGKPKRALEDFTRFLVNSTVGIGGLFDVARANGLPRHEEDFGQTFAVWGLGEGPFLMLPFRGPANTGHAVGMVLDAFTNPAMLLRGRERAAAVAVNVIDVRASLLSSESLVSGDRYLFFRDAYQQRREYLILDGQIEEDPFLDDYDDLDYEEEE
ncbi:MAG: VacJ family lipoprotein [Pseudomonadales bacterium]